MCGIIYVSSSVKRSLCRDQKSGGSGRGRLVTTTATARIRQFLRGAEYNLTYATILGYLLMAGEILQLHKLPPSRGTN